MAPVDTPRAAASSRDARAAEITVGITSNTRPEWNGPEGFMLSIDESSEIGYTWIETFFNYVMQWENNPQGLKEELGRRGLEMLTVSNSGPLRMDFVDPSQRAGVVEDHMRLVRFINSLGCTHLKINIGGGRATREQTQSPEVYREMARTFSEIGRRMADMGMRFGVHAHGSHANYGAFGSRPDIDAIMELTDPRHVYLILDTGWITMAGMDPVQLTRDYTDRIIEYHLKDVEPANRGGAPLPTGDEPEPTPLEVEYPGVDMDNLPASIEYRDRQFFELGKGGVDFPGILQVLNDASWKGWFTVELDSTATTAKSSATVTKEYIERILGLSAGGGQRPSWNT